MFKRIGIGLAGIAFACAGLSWVLAFAALVMGRLDIAMIGLGAEGALLAILMVGIVCVIIFYSLRYIVTGKEMDWL